MTPRVLLGESLKKDCGSSRKAAKKLFVTDSMLSKIIGGTRNLSKEIKPQMSGISSQAGLAILIEDTGWEGLFGFYETDRHPQTLLRLVEKEEHEAEKALQEIGWRTIGKNSGEDLTAEDEVAMRFAAKELIESICADINLLIEWDSRFPQIGIKDMFRQKKSPSTATCNISYK